LGDIKMDEKKAKCTVCGKDMEYTGKANLYNSTATIVTAQPDNYVCKNPECERYNKITLIG